jgi:hypothetical protein
MKTNETKNETKHDPLPKPSDSLPRDPQPTPGPSYKPTSAGQSRKSRTSETGTRESRTSLTPDSCGSDGD